MRERVIPALRSFHPDLIIISAGFDAAKSDVGNTKNIGPVLPGSNLLPSDYNEMTRLILGVAQQCCPGRVVSLLEGGYGRWVYRDAPRPSSAPLPEGGAVGPLPSKAKRPSRPKRSSRRQSPRRSGRLSSQDDQPGSPSSEESPQRGGVGGIARAVRRTQHSRRLTSAADARLLAQATGLGRDESEEDEASPVVDDADPPALAPEASPEPAPQKCWVLERDILAECCTSHFRALMDGPGPLVQAPSDFVN